jgi:hypothetical protein
VAGAASSAMAATAATDPDRLITMDPSRVVFDVN